MLTVVQVQYDFELVQFILIQCNISCTGTNCLELVQTNLFFLNQFILLFHICLRPITSDTQKTWYACNGCLRDQVETKQDYSSKQIQKSVVQILVCFKILKKQIKKKSV